MFRLKEAISDTDVRVLANIANEIWHECFPSILSKDQIDYMLERFQSARAMETQIREQKYTYYFIEADGETVGYTAIQPETEKLFLSKLYLYARYRGKGYARMTVDALREIALAQEKRALHLTVNRHNARAIEVYRKLGFVVTGTQVADIGNGFVMDDYLMELEI